MTRETANVTVKVFTTTSPDREYSSAGKSRGCDRQITVSCPFWPKSSKKVVEELVACTAAVERSTSVDIRRRHRVLTYTGNGELDDDPDVYASLPRSGLLHYCIKSIFNINSNEDVDEKEDRICILRKRRQP